MEIPAQFRVEINSYSPQLPRHRSQSIPQRTIFGKHRCVRVVAIQVMGLANSVIACIDNFRQQAGNGFTALTARFNLLDVIAWCVGI